MKRVEIIYKDFSKVSRLQPDWAGTQGRAHMHERKIFLDIKFPPKTQWSERVILEHEKAHFYIWDAGLDLDTQKEELLADWLGLIKTPNKFLHVNELALKRWIKDGLKGPQVILRIVQLLGIGDPAQYQLNAAKLWRAM